MERKITSDEEQPCPSTRYGQRGQRSQEPSNFIATPRPAPRYFPWNNFFFFLAGNFSTTTHAKIAPTHAGHHPGLFTATPVSFQGSTLRSMVLVATSCDTWMVMESRNFTWSWSPQRNLITARPSPSLGSFLPKHGKGGQTLVL